jgi:hypothetical protein
VQPATLKLLGADLAAGETSVFAQFRGLGLGSIYRPTRGSKNARDIEVEWLRKNNQDETLGLRIIHMYDAFVVRGDDIHFS